MKTKLIYFGVAAVIGYMLADSLSSLPVAKGAYGVGANIGSGASPLDGVTWV